MELDAAQRARDDAMDDLDRAEAAAWRAHVVASLLAEPGLVYAAADGDPCGVHLVAAAGALLGEVRTTSRGILRDWFGYPTGGGAPLGPFCLPRGAAVAVACAVLGEHVTAIVRHVPAGASPDAPHW